MRIVSVTADGIRRGDVIDVGGIPHTVCDVREVGGRRKRLENLIRRRQGPMG